MASGFGVNGTLGRCFPFIQDFTSCLAENATPADEVTGCKALRDDYLECLHRTKEASRLMVIRKEAYEQQHGGSKRHKEHEEGGHH